MLENCLIFGKVLCVVVFKIVSLGLFQAVVTIGNGNRVSFWLDNWSTNSALKDLIPNLYTLNNMKLCTVKEGCQMIFGDIGFGRPFWRRLRLSEKETCM